MGSPYFCIRKDIKNTEKRKEKQTVRDILIRHKDNYIECEIEGLELTYTYSDEPKRHHVVRLRDRLSYETLKNEVNNFYNSCRDKGDAYLNICEFLETVDCHDKYFTKDAGHVYCDLRDRDEINDYLKEAWDKVWLMRNCDVSSRIPLHEASRPDASDYNPKMKWVDNLIQRVEMEADPPIMNIPLDENGEPTWQPGYITKIYI